MYAPKPTEDRPSDLVMNPMLSELIAMTVSPKLKFGDNHVLLNLGFGANV
jgi:hypothetical protein